MGNNFTFFADVVDDVVATIVKDIGKQFRQAFMVEETKRDIFVKVAGIESRVEKDGKRLIEMEKYKLDLGELRDSICNKQTNILELNGVSHAVPLPEHFTGSQEALLPMQRDIPAYNKYVLTKETKEALKTAQFDVWGWEPNEDMIILILATDMARHAEILENFKQKLDNFDYSSTDHLNTLKMILIKACDISNE